MIYVINVYVAGNKDTPCGGWNNNCTEFCWLFNWSLWICWNFNNSSNNRGNSLFGPRRWCRQYFYYCTGSSKKEKVSLQNSQVQN